ncbi:MAG: MBL fold metallo-hydrolase RNA specificity domain-containing protein, partial [Planctomycetota bacterium]
EKDARAAAALFSPVEYGQTRSLGDGLECTWRDAGHIFGSSMLELVVTEGGESRTILFSGDVGRWDKPILRDPTIFDEADYVLCESTYGDRTHKAEDSIAGDLERVVNATREAGGNLVIPSFAVERAHELMYHLNVLLREDRVPHLRVFLDSPMAVRVTDVFKKHPDIYDREMKEYVMNGESPFDFPGLTLVRSVDESKSINHIAGTVIVIAGSGMCTGGRIKHHLVRNIGRRESTILFIGYQARGTLGRHIVSGEKKVRIFGKPFRVRARVEQIHGFSGHADRDELVKWLSGLAKPPRRLFVTHGEEEASEAFAKLVREEKGWEVSVPEYNESVELD